MNFNGQANILSDLDVKPVQRFSMCFGWFFFNRIKHEFTFALPCVFFLSCFSEDNIVQRSWGSMARVSCSPRGTNTLWHITQNQGSRSGVSGVLLTSKVARSHALCNLIILNVWTQVRVMPHRSGSHWWQEYTFQISTRVCSKASGLRESCTLEFSLLTKDYFPFPLCQQEMFWWNAGGRVTLLRKIK